MSDPRYTDPRYSNSQLSDPAGRRDDSGGMWGWIAGIVVVALIALFLIVGGKGINQNTASNTAPMAGTGAPVRSVTPPSTTGGTTGMGSPSQFPAQQKPALQKPASGGTQ